MEILIGLISSGITEITKFLAKRFGLALSKKIVHGIVFGVVFIGTLLITKGVISWDMIVNYVQIFSVAYTNYQLLVKPIKNKLLPKAKK